MKNLFILISLLFSLAQSSIAQVVNIPDANFKKALVNNPLINTNKDAEIQVSEAVAYKDTIDVTEKMIQSLVGIEAFINLERLSCPFNNLTSLDVSKNIALVDLSCYGNQLAVLDVSKNIALVDFDCSFNQLTVLDVSKNTALVDLYCSFNELTDLDLSKNIALTRLHCNNNQLVSLDISKSIALDRLYCYKNSLTSIDLSKNANLARLRCYSNQLTSLNIKNGKNTLLTNFDATANPSLICIQVDNPDTVPISWKKDAISNYYLLCFGQAPIVNIPDINFRKALLDNPLINTNKDAEIQITEAIAYKGNINVDQKTIQSLVGIEAFINLKNLSCSNNQLTVLNVSKNTTLTTLYCSSNQLTNIDVSKNTTLTSLYCSSNQLTNIDVNENTTLTTLYCSSNQLTNIDVSKNTALVNLDCYINKLSNIDVSKNTDLNFLNCSYNELIALDISKNTALNFLDCSYNKLIALDISKNTALDRLYCRSNKLTALDVSKNVALSTFRCDINQLTSLNIKNGQNKLLTFFDARQNPNLTCIQVDNLNTGLMLWLKDATATYNTLCSTAVNDDFLSNTIRLYPNPTTNEFFVKWEDNFSAVTLDLYNSQGALLLTQNLTSGKSINVEDLPKGLYICQIKSENKTFKVEKVIVQ